MALGRSIRIAGCPSKNLRLGWQSGRLPASTAQVRVPRHDRVYELFATQPRSLAESIGNKALDIGFPPRAVLRITSIPFPERVQQALELRAHLGSKPTECVLPLPDSCGAGAT